MDWRGQRPTTPAGVRAGRPQGGAHRPGRLYPNAPHFTGEYNPEGLQIRSVHLGVLTEWGGRDEWGGAWYGKVTYTITAKDRQEKVTHWVPSWALRPAGGDPPKSRR